jgi:ABC-type Fe3+-hydroxamate transport system substrate-binding protein
MGGVVLCSQMLRHHWVRLVPCAVVVGLLLAGCGSSSSQPQSASNKTTTVTTTATKTVPTYKTRYRTRTVTTTATTTVTTPVTTTVTKTVTTPPPVTTSAQSCNGADPCPPRGPSGADGTYNCSDFDTQQEAQDYYDQVGDIDGLDANHDGIPCESLP